jgi:hypothetical protein
MKYGTKLIYGIDPQQLANMRHIDALHACKKGAKNRLDKLIKPSMLKWGKRRSGLIAYIQKSINWLDRKIKEIE